ncbi:MAG: F0F1 ATP synthase subunit B [Candidatus Paceibacterota bacterium]
MEAGILTKIGFDLEVALANFVNFLIIFLLFKIFLFKPIQNLIDKRREEIKNGLAQASQAQISLNLAEEESEKLIKEARLKANSILSEAKSHADDISEKAILEGRANALKIKERAEHDIAQEKDKMRQDVEKEMTSLVSSLTEKVVRGESK